MKIYLDTCSLHRPLDNKSQLRVALEAEAILGVLARCETGKVSLISSEVLELEIDHNPNPNSKSYVIALLERAESVIKIETNIANRAKELESRGLKAFDALHIASAEAGGVDYFCTCDDRLLKKARRQSDIHVKIVNPIELAGEVPDE